MNRKQTWEKPRMDFHAAGTEEYRRLQALLAEGAGKSAGNAGEAGREGNRPERSMPGAEAQGKISP